MLYSVSDEFLLDAHNKEGCRGCHLGTKGINLKQDGHKGYLADPSIEDSKYCAPCHGEITQYHSEGLHRNQTGFKTMLLKRSGETELTSTMEKMLDEQCSQCHTTCGQCHVSRPYVADGGLVEGHKFRKIPCQTRNCIACHEDRVGAEYTGGNARLEASVHYLAGMKCFDCHSGEEIHGTGADNRYEVDVLPRCIDCHEDAFETGNEMHEQHGDDLECHVCHSIPYKNCYRCHVTKPGSADTDESIIYEEIDFRIGRNPIKSDGRPWEFVLLRHVPVYPELFEDYDIELVNFSSEPTWKYTSPHNIQRNTPQNASCNKCHGNQNIFLTDFYVNIKIIQGLMYEEELEANQALTIEEVPGKLL